jgi:hypothetical protein
MHTLENNCACSTLCVAFENMKIRGHFMRAGHDGFISFVKVDPTTDDAAKFDFESISSNKSVLIKPRFIDYF